DLDPSLVELPDERLLLEAGQLVRLDDVVHVRRADRATLLARVEHRAELLLGQQAFDVDGGHGGIGRDGPCSGASLRSSHRWAMHASPRAVESHWRRHESSVVWGSGEGIERATSRGAEARAGALR